MKQNVVKILPVEIKQSCCCIVCMTDMHARQWLCGLT